MTKYLPKISCLTVTLDRIVLLKQAVYCYLRQSYLNKELIIVTAGGAAYKQAIQSFVKRLDRSDIQIVFLDPSRGHLGNLRNASIDAASGEVICQWDDDDLYHPDRLAKQFQAMFQKQAQASFFTDHLQFFTRQRELFWVDWTAGGKIKGKAQQMPATLMMYKDKRFRYVDRPGGGEDCQIRDMFYDKIQIANLSGLGYLYVYRFHGKNYLPLSHHRHIANFGSSSQFLLQKKQLLLRALRAYELPLPFILKGAQGETVFHYNYEPVGDLYLEGTTPNFILNKASIREPSHS